MHDVQEPCQPCQLIQSSLPDSAFSLVCRHVSCHVLCGLEKGTPAGGVPCLTVMADVRVRQVRPGTAGGEGANERLLVPAAYGKDDVMYLQKRFRHFRVKMRAGVLFDNVQHLFLREWLLV